MLRLIHFAFAFSLLLSAFDNTAKSLGRQYLNVSELNNNNTLGAKSPLPMAVFSSVGKVTGVNSALQGHLSFSPIKGLSQSHLTEKSDVYQFERRTRPDAFTNKRRTLPHISFDFVQSGQAIIPTKQQLQISEHPHWDYFIGIGEIWREIADGDKARISLPFALVEKNQNCLHNGAITFLIDNDGKTSNFYYQISSETCLYYKVDMWGKGKVDYSEKPIANSQNVIKNHQLAQQDIITTKPLSDLKKQYPTLAIEQLALANTIKQADMSSFGIMLNGDHYISGCMTRYGAYPFCSQMVMPSYSTAKSIFAGLAMFYLADKHSDVFQQQVSDWVEECQGEQWQGVTFGHLLNMSTGNYQNIGHSADEGAEHSQIFFKAKSHQDKINYSCQYFSHKSQPGTTFVYHTSDTYLLGSALNNYLNAQQKNNGAQERVNIFQQVFVDVLWPQLNLSATAYSSRRTTGSQQQPFAGYGLFFTQDDIAKLIRFLMMEQSGKSSLLDNKALSPALQRHPSADDMTTQYEFIHYNNGFWKQNVSKLLSCEKDTWLPYMLGYGGIGIVLASSNIQYYYVSDSDQYIWRDAIKELDKISPLCRH
mgnify:CR=1 FL=1